MDGDSALEKNGALLWKIKSQNKRKKFSDKEHNAQIDVQKAFEANLKYISDLEKNVDVIKKQFVKRPQGFI